MSAEKTARDVARRKGIDPNTVKRYCDMDNRGAPCWIVTVDRTSAVVVYEDDPASVVSTGNAPGRYAP